MQRLENWGDTYGPSLDLEAGVLLLGGQRDDGSWWYQLAGYANDDPSDDEGCWPIGGGSFDDGRSIRLSNGLRLPKAPGFEASMGGIVVAASAAFPGREGDWICVDIEGRAVSITSQGERRSRRPCT